MSSEQRVRTALKEEASAVAPDPQAWSRLQAAIAADTRRRPLPYGLLAAAAAVLVVVVALAQQNDGDDETQVVTPPTTTTVAPPPATVIAYGADGRIVELSALDGSEVHVVARARPSEGEGNLSVSSDGTTVYYDSGAAVWRVARAGGTPERIGAGRLPAVSPDGATLAYAGPAKDIGEWLVLRDLATGRERTIVSKANLWYALDSLSWAPDSRHLTVGMGWEGQDFVLELDSRSARNLQDGPFIERPATGDPNSDYFGHVHAGASDYIAVQKCCYTAQGEEVVFTLQWSRIVRLPQGEEVDDVGKREVRSLSVGNDGGVVYTLDGGEVRVVRDGRTETLADGYVTAVWAPTPTAA